MWASGRHSVQLDAEFTGQLAYRRASVNLGTAWRRCSSSWSRCGLGFCSRCGCRCSGRCSFSFGSSRSGGGWSGSRCGALYFQLEDEVTGADFVFQLDCDAFHHASSRRRNFHGSLVGFQGDQRLVGFDGVANLDQQLDDLGLARRTDVRNMNVLNRGGGRCSSRGRRGLGCSGRLFSGRR